MGRLTQVSLPAVVRGGRRESDPPVIVWIVICLGVFLIGLTKSGLGAGLGLIVVPIVAIALGHTDRGSAAALGLLLPLLLMGDLISVYQYRKLFDFRLVRPLVVPTAVGIVLGSGILWAIHRPENERFIGTLVRLEIGVESLLLVGLHWWRTSRGEGAKLMAEPMRGWIAGTYTGISTTLAHAAGPVVALYLLPLKPDRRTFVGTTALFFAMANASKLPTYYLAGQFEHAELGFTVRFVPCLIAGAAVGFWLNKRLTDFGFLRFVYVATFAIGVYLTIDATVALLR